MANSACVQAPTCPTAAGESGRPHFVGALVAPVPLGTAPLLACLAVGPIEDLRRSGDPPPSGPGAHVVTPPAWNRCPECHKLDCTAAR